MPSDEPSTGARVRRLRESLGLTQAELGSIIGVHGVTVCRWESAGASIPDFQTGLLHHLDVAATKRGASDVRNVLAASGPVAALHYLLCFAFAKARGMKPRSISESERRKRGHHAG